MSQKAEVSSRRAVLVAQLLEKSLLTPEVPSSILINYIELFSYRLQSLNDLLPQVTVKTVTVPRQHSTAKVNFIYISV